MSGLLTKEVIGRVWARVAPMIQSDMQVKYGYERTDLVVFAGFRHSYSGHAMPMLTESIGEPIPNGVAGFKQVDLEKNKVAKYWHIAGSKFFVSMRTGKRTRDVRANELLPGETLFFGSEVIDNIVVAASGCFPEDDELYATWFAAALRAEAEREMRTLQGSGEIWVPGTAT